MKLKILAAIYFFGLSLRKTSRFLSLFDISYVLVEFTIGLKRVIKVSSKKRKLIAIDETILKLENGKSSSARDVETGEILFI